MPSIKYYGWRQALAHLAKHRTDHEQIVEKAITSSEKALEHPFRDAIPRSYTDHLVYDEIDENTTTSRRKNLQKIIHKQVINLSLSREQTLYLPRSAVLLNIQNQREQAVLWYLLDRFNENDVFPVSFTFFQTGEVIPEEAHLEANWQFINTVLFNNDHYVLHFFVNKENLSFIEGSLARQA